MLINNSFASSTLKTKDFMLTEEVNTGKELSTEEANIDAELRSKANEIVRSYKEKQMNTLTNKGLI